MKIIFRLLLLCSFITIIILPAALVGLSIEKNPLINEHQDLSYDNMNRVKNIIRQIKPYHMRRKQIKRVAISEPDLNLMASYAITQGFKVENFFAQVRLSRNHIQLKSTYQIGSTPMGEYVNVIAGFKTSGSKIEIENVKIGRVMIPGAIIKPALLLSDQLLRNYDLYQNAKQNYDAVKTIIAKENLLTIVYEWNPEALAGLHESGKSLLFPEDHQDRLLAYYNQLAEVVKPYHGRQISVARILKPMFEFASRQSTISNTPALENKALIQVLALYSTRNTIHDFIHKDKARQIQRPERVGLLLKNRSDLAKHYLVSAGIAVSAGSTFANFIGLAKEVDDSDRGSGFSFADLAADRAGVRLGELSVASKSQAQALQKKISESIKESDFMPDIDHLPERIMKLEFKKKYKDFDSETYALVDNEIRRRIKNCRVYQ